MTASPQEPVPDYQRLRHLGVATLYEAAGRRGLVDIELQRIVPGSSASGPARTVFCGPGGNRAVHGVMERILPGEVLVLAVDQAVPVALVGELLDLQAQRAGAAGILVDGAVRDLDRLREIGLPVWARWIRARGAGKEEDSTLDAPVVVGGARICTGDAIVLDGDGAVVIPAAAVGEVTAAAETREARERVTRGRIAAGEFTYDIYRLAGGTPPSA